MPPGPLYRDVYVDDEKCKQCAGCRAIFNTLRRKYHCRICGRHEYDLHCTLATDTRSQGQVFCSYCASSFIRSSGLGQTGMIRVCNLCIRHLARAGFNDKDDRQSVSSTATYPVHQVNAIAPIPPYGSLSTASGVANNAFRLPSPYPTVKGRDSNVLDNPGRLSIVSPFPNRDHSDWEASAIDNLPPFRRAPLNEVDQTLENPDPSHCPGPSHATAHNTMAQAHSNARRSPSSQGI